jgi:hypothetical protein
VIILSPIILFGAYLRLHFERGSAEQNIVQLNFKTYDRYLMFHRIKTSYNCARVHTEIVNGGAIRREKNGTLDSQRENQKDGTLDSQRENQKDGTLDSQRENQKDGTSDTQNQNIETSDLQKDNQLDIASNSHNLFTSKMQVHSSSNDLFQINSVFLASDEISRNEHEFAGIPVSVSDSIVSIPINDSIRTQNNKKGLTEGAPIHNNFLSLFSRKRKHISGIVFRIIVHLMISAVFEFAQMAYFIPMNDNAYLVKEMFYYLNMSNILTLINIISYYLNKVMYSVRIKEVPYLIKYYSLGCAVILVLITLCTFIYLFSTNDTNIYPIGVEKILILFFGFISIFFSLYNLLVFVKDINFHISENKLREFKHLKQIKSQLISYNLLTILIFFTISIVQIINFVLSPKNLTIWQDVSVYNTICCLIRYLFYFGFLVYAYYLHNGTKN